ncbi:MAG: glycosyltransferase family 4 protein [Acidimicrobiales bacterium]
MLTVSLYTLGSPDQLTGGYLYHRRLADLAPRYGAHLELVSLPNLPFPLPAAAGQARLRRGQPYDVAVVDSIAAAFLAPWPMTGPIAAILHQPPGGIDHGPGRRWMQAVLDRLLYRRCDALIVASEALATSVPGRHCIVVPPGSDVAVPPDGVPPELRHGRRVAFLNVGNWMARKGTLELLDGFSRLPADRATLHLVGRTDVERRYGARVAARLGEPDLAGRVVVHGSLTREQVAAMYAGSDVFVLPSYREPYGTVYGEALAAGLPVVGWRAGNLPNLAVHEREAVIVEPGDVAALAAALDRLATDDPYRKRLARAAGDRGRRLPTWDDTAARFFTVMKDLAAGTAR